MKKENFITLILVCLAVLFFGIGFCLVSIWESRTSGILLGILGLFLIWITYLLRRKMQGKPPIQWNGKMLFRIVFGCIGLCIFGWGVCLSLTSPNDMVQGILIGIVGLVLLICLIPLCKGLY